MTKLPDQTPRKITAATKRRIIERGQRHMVNSIQLSPERTSNE